MAPTSQPAPASALAAAVARADARHDLFPQGGLVLVAVSGGPDSVALLAALREHAPAKGLRLHLAHLDHMLRPEAVDDAAWVRQLAADWSVPATVDARDVRRVAARLGRGLEDAGRLARYAFLAGVAARIGADRLALAHQKEDQAETVLMNLLRGSGLAGLRGMRPLAPFPLDVAELAQVEAPPAAAGKAAWPPPVARPLLGVSRQEILADLQARAIQPRHDATNQDPAFLRNRVRRELLPLLAGYNPEVVDALARGAQALAGDWDFLETAADEAWGAHVRDEPGGGLAMGGDAWRVLHPALRRAVLRRAVARLAPRAARDLGWEAVEAALAFLEEGASAGMSLPGRLRLSPLGGGFLLAPEAVPAGPPPLPSATAPQALTVPGLSHWRGWTLDAQVRERRLGESATLRDPWQAVLDLDSLPAGAPLALRARLPGDRMQPLGMGGQHKRLQDLFVDAQVPQAERDAWPVLLAGEAVAWVPGLRIDERFRIGPSTRRVLALTARPPRKQA